VQQLAACALRMHGHQSSPPDASRCWFVPYHPQAPLLHCKPWALRSTLLTLNMESRTAILIALPQPCSKDQRSGAVRRQLSGAAQIAP
jgi:hypothetical protein